MIDDFGFEPTDDQRYALETFAHFLADRHDNVVMILRGSAGTGKTSIAGAMVRTLHRLGQKLTLLAPTGRAAKVFSLNSGLPAYTIHRRIYREKAYQGLDGQFNLNENRYRNMLFVVDEASMVSSVPTGESSFGSGSLLDDLMKYVYGGDNCRLLLIGDSAQLPPVGEDEAPALSAEMLAGYGMRVYECDLNEVLRQSRDSGILYNATLIRQLITHDEATHLPKITFSGFADIVKVRGDELIESLATSYSQVGLDEAIVVTRSNKRANVYNQGIRNMVLDREDALTSGDMLMIVRNNYYWTERNKSQVAGPQLAGGLSPDASRDGEGNGLPSRQMAAVVKTASAPPVHNAVGTPPTEEIVERAPSFLANGDRAKVLRVRNVREFYGFTFADVSLQFPDYDNYEMQVTAVLNSLTTDAPALTREQNEQLYAQVMEDYSDLPTKAERLKALRQDIYFNALQIKFAYAVTCHKAQGGQWEHVYLDQGYMTDDMLTPDYIHWLYTAFTRATAKLFLVNWPKNQEENA
jgi:tRNA A37 threonylcarbamoyladenosine biosynthesis protein TsaE